MADEITVTVSLGFSKDTKSESLAFTGLTFDMSGNDYVKKTQTIGTSDEALDIGDITTPGWFIAKNLDLTNSVQIRADNGTTDAETVNMKAGEPCLFRHNGTAPYAVATGGSCEIIYLMVED